MLIAATKAEPVPAVGNVAAEENKMTGSRTQMVDREGLIELNVGEDVRNSPRFNKDIAPTQASERTWSKWNIAALWVGMSICVPTYTLGGVLTAYFGLSVGEALFAILLANVIVLAKSKLHIIIFNNLGIIHILQIV